MLFMDDARKPARRRFSRIAATARRLAGSGHGLHGCPACGQSFICPVAWETDGDDHWLIALRCGACDTWREVRATNAQAAAFDLVLDRQSAEIRRELLRIDRAQMQAELEYLMAAFEHDLIDASDFAL
jgi:hypothetical protein